jgi:hypothetical protein
MWIISALARLMRASNAPKYSHRIESVSQESQFIALKFINEKRIREQNEKKNDCGSLLNLFIIQ